MSNRSKDKFAIVSPTDNTSFTVKLDSVKMMIRKVQVNSVIQAAHAKALEMGTAKNPITRGECKTCTLMYPKDPEYLLQVSERVMTLGPYSYLFIDLRQVTPDKMRLRANILEDEE